MSKIFNPKKKKQYLRKAEKFEKLAREYSDGIFSDIYRDLARRFRELATRYR